MLDHIIEQGFMNKNYREMIITSSDPKEILEEMDSYRPNHAVKWR
jgi:predicted Rossmann-fold nucleotide-binding protein